MYYIMVSSDSASTRLVALFAALFAVAMVSMIVSVGLNAFLIYFKIIKKRNPTKVTPTPEVC